MLQCTYIHHHFLALLSSSSSKWFHLICNLLILSSLHFFLWLSYFFPRILSKSPPIRFSLFLDFSFALGRSSLMLEEELHVLSIDSSSFFSIKFPFSYYTVCFNRFSMLLCWGKQASYKIFLGLEQSVRVGARAISVYIFPKRPSETSSTMRNKYYFPRTEKSLARNKNMSQEVKSISQ